MSKRKSQWQSIDTLPRRATDKILLSSADVVLVGRVGHYGDIIVPVQGVLMSFAREMLPVTHWMPIPPLPEEER